MKLSLVHNNLGVWYEQHHRVLPWRETCDPYRIWLSEIILQQTRVEQGMGYYLRVVDRFPNVMSLAEASEAEVLRYWILLACEKPTSCCKNTCRAGARRKSTPKGRRFRVPRWGERRRYISFLEKFAWCGRLYSRSCSLVCLQPTLCGYWWKCISRVSTIIRLRDTIRHHRG